MELGKHLRECACSTEAARDIVRAIYAGLTGDRREEGWMRSEAEIEAANRYKAFMAGFHAGSHGGVKPQAYDGHWLESMFDDGYREGQVAQRAASRRASECTGYVPSILR